MLTKKQLGKMGKFVIYVAKFKKENTIKQKQYLSNEDYLILNFGQMMSKINLRNTNVQNNFT